MKKGRKIGSSQKGSFSTDHYDSKGHKIGTTYHGGFKDDHYFNGKRSGSSYHGRFKTDHYDSKGHHIGESYKDFFGDTNTELKKNKHLPYSLWTSVRFCDIVCATNKGGIHMMRKRQANSNNQKRAVLNRDFPRWSRSLFITEVQNEHH